MFGDVHAAAEHDENFFRACGCELCEAFCGSSDLTELHRHVIMERASGINREVWMDMEQVKQAAHSRLAAAQRRHLFWMLFLGMGAAGGAVRACIGNWMCSREAHGGGKKTHRRLESAACVCYTEYKQAKHRLCGKDAAGSGVFQAR